MLYEVILQEVIGQSIRRVFGSRCTVLDDAGVYSAMLKDAKKSRTLRLTSFHERDPTAEGGPKDKREYFTYVTACSENEATSVHRLVAIPSREKAEWVLSTIQHPERSPSFHARLLPEHIDVNSPMTFRLNLQIFDQKVVYIFDPAFSGGNESACWHLRIADRSAAKMFQSTIYDPLWSRSTPLKSGPHSYPDVIRRLPVASGQFLYNLRHTHLSEQACIERVSDDAAPRDIWEKFATTIRQSERETLISYEAQQLRKRWADTRATVLLREGAICSFVSADALLPNCMFDSNPAGIDVFELKTGWTRPDLRRRGLSTWCRTKLLDQFQPDVLLLSFCNGVAASPVLSKLGWQRLSWKAAPYLSGLVGWFSNDGFYKTGVGQTSATRSAFNGRHIPYRIEDKAKWERRIHLWCNDPERAFHVDESLRKVSGSVRQWRHDLRAAFGENREIADLYCT